MGSDQELIAQSVSLAEQLMVAAMSARRRAERRAGRRIARLLAHPDGLAFVLALTDEVLRIRDPRRAALRFQAVVGSLPSTQVLQPLDRLALRVGAALAVRIPGTVMPLVAARVRRELSPYVIDAAPRRLARHLARRRRQGIRLNLNVLGEAILGDDEAERRLARVIDLLARPDVDYVSVKISALCAQINVAAFDTEVDRIAVVLRRLYSAASGFRPAKFVNLDMEEYHDLELTVAAFCRVLGEEAFVELDAGIVLQAYIPDSLDALLRLCDWARIRRQAGGGAIKIRLVKGANLAMEHVDAEIHGWEPAPFATKVEVDAHYKRMLDAVLDPANAGAIRVGVATHNLFELAWALTVSEDRHLRAMVDVEMLEGMAPSTARAVRRVAGDLLLYAPVAARRDRESVIAYLVRRFDENTGPDNFLRHQYELRPGALAWAAERARFERAVADRHLAVTSSRRAGSGVPVAMPGTPSSETGSPPFVNEPDSDWALAPSRAAAHIALARRDGAIAAIVTPVVNGRQVPGPATGEGRDPARPSEIAYRWVPAGADVVEEALACAGPAGEQWRGRPVGERAQVLRAVGDELVRRRAHLLTTMAIDGGKTLAEGDPEVSEAVDFARYYAAGSTRLAARAGRRWQPFGVMTVIPPWNFPLAIPAGGILAALAAGNSVIFKPAPETVAVGRALTEACWAAGVPRSALQFVPCDDGPQAARLVTDPRVGGVILTGSSETARMFLGWRPDLALRAETSGKNAMVITAAADLDAAVADVVRSAFGHAGQKCSAASLAIVEAPVYDDPRFFRQLADAVTTLRPGPGWDPATTIGPLIRSPQGPLDRALNRLDHGETWLVAPRRLTDDGQLWSPGVRIGVQPGTWFHLTECFGPVLGVMRAADLQEATAWQNAPVYGLTAGLHSLDPAEIDWWLSTVQAGNLYVNRTITGAIVGRQPFGGWKHSVFGPGAKAGGPNYLLNLGCWHGSPSRVEDVVAAVEEVRRTTMASADLAGLAAEANLLRYVPLSRVTLRAGADVADTAVDMALGVAAALGVEVELSSPVGRNAPAALRVVREDDDALAARIGRLSADKLRLLGGVDGSLRLAAYDAEVWVDDTPVGDDPGIEALRWAREQSVSITRHRHGNITRRLPEPGRSG